MVSHVLKEGSLIIKTINNNMQDLTLILDGSQDTLEASLDVIEKFSKISGLRLDNKKTEVIWIGSKARSSETLCPEKGFSWQEVKVKTLGVWLSVEPELTMILNFEEKNKKVQNVLKNWQYQRLSLLGKIAILKSLVASQLVNVLSPLQTNHPASYQRIERSILSYPQYGTGNLIRLKETL